MGKQLEDVVSVHELEVKEEEDESKEDKKDADLVEPEIDVAVFRFKVKCGDKPTKPQAGKEAGPQ